MKEQASKLVVALADAMAKLLQSRVRSWSRAYLRYEHHDHSTKLSASYVAPDGVHLLGALQAERSFANCEELASRLHSELARGGMPFCVALLVLESDLSYKVHFEPSDASRWQITKLSGGTGVPQGLAV